MRAAGRGRGRVRAAAGAGAGVRPGGGAAAAPGSAAAVREVSVGRAGGAFLPPPPSGLPAVRRQRGPPRGAVRRTGPRCGWRRGSGLPGIPRGCLSSALPPGGGRGRAAR